MVFLASTCRSGILDVSIIPPFFPFLNSKANSFIPGPPPGLDRGGDGNTWHPPRHWPRRCRALAGLPEKERKVNSGCRLCDPLDMHSAYLRRSSRERLCTQHNNSRDLTSILALWSHQHIQPKDSERDILIDYLVCLVCKRYSNLK